MTLCVPVVFNQESLRKVTSLSSKKYVSPLAIPWYLFGTRIFLMTVAVICISFEITALSHPFIGLVVLSYAIDGAFLFSLLMRDIKDHDQLSRVNLLFMTFFILRLSLAAVLFCVLAGRVSIIYWTATAGCLLLDVAAWVLHNESCIVNLNLAKELLRTDVEELIGSGVGITIDTWFETNNGKEEKLLEGVPADSRDIIRGMLWRGAELQLDGKRIDYASWDLYRYMNKRINEDLDKMNKMIERNNELRDDLLKQNDQISQMRNKVYRRIMESSDISQLPVSAVPSSSWLPEKIEGMFIWNDTLVPYAKLDDVREMTKHAVSVRKNLMSFETESRQLKEGLQARKSIIDELIAMILNEASSVNHGWISVDLDKTEESSY